ncbi:MAG: hypothetical protein KDD34_09230, partial [Bdellovibrionales bacterium]|nr:hypothetical protein [Bdellovibrionales bacterium]
ARALMSFRKLLIENGFFVLAPCTHQGLCPLLTHSKKDWCYDRVFLEAPDWFKKLESHLPMKNRTLTFSYLIASKKFKPHLPKNSARVIGDTLKEKGKTRQMVCRGQEREFLSWLDRLGPAPEIPHGALIQIPEDYLKKGDSEIRATQHPISDI